MSFVVVEYVSVNPGLPLPGFGIVGLSGVVGRDGVPARWLKREVADDVAAALNDSPATLTS